jgi:hypothetical protein
MVGMHTCSPQRSSPIATGRYVLTSGQACKLRHFWPGAPHRLQAEICVSSISSEPRPKAYYCAVIARGTSVHCGREPCSFRDDPATTASESTLMDVWLHCVCSYRNRQGCNVVRKSRIAQQLHSRLRPATLHQAIDQRKFEKILPFSSEEATKALSSCDFDQTSLQHYTPTHNYS